MTVYTPDPRLVAFQLGERVEHRSVDQRLARPGIVVSVFYNLSGEVRYVVEHGSGLRIYNAGQLRKVIA